MVDNEPHTPELAGHYATALIEAADEVQKLTD